MTQDRGALEVIEKNLMKKSFRSYVMINRFQLFEKKNEWLTQCMYDLCGMHIYSKLFLYTSPYKKFDSS